MTIKVKVRGHNGYDIDDFLINTDKKTVSDVSFSNCCHYTSLKLNVTLNGRVSAARKILKYN